jgi:predicted esterase YcpF (UPF0227 family)
MRYILYLHGFHSSPNSQKAVVFKRAIENNFDDIQVLVPQLCVLPHDAIVQINSLMESHNDHIIGVVGSSLGGYLATYLHNKFNKPIVVINPAVKPFELLQDYLGEQIHPITGESYTITESDINELKSLYQQNLNSSDNVWLLQQEKDEVLDYQQALERYKGCKVTFELGGSHGFDQFERFPIQIAEFLNKS